MSQQDPYTHREIADLHKTQWLRFWYGAAWCVVAISTLIVLFSLRSLNEQVERSDKSTDALEATRARQEKFLEVLRREVSEAQEKAIAAELSAADATRRWEYAEQELIQCHDATDAAASALTTCQEIAAASAYRCGWWKRDRDACYCSLSGDCNPVAIGWGGISLGADR